MPVATTGYLEFLCNLCVHYLRKISDGFNFRQKSVRKKTVRNFLASEIFTVQQNHAGKPKRT